MGYPKKVRLHYGNGNMRAEPFSRFCAANGQLTRDEGLALLDQWVRDGTVRRRPDGGFDVVKFVPRAKAGKP